jgi:hypothetical protein
MKTLPTILLLGTMIIWPTSPAPGNDSSDCPLIETFVYPDGTRIISASEEELKSMRQDRGPTTGELAYDSYAIHTGFFVSKSVELAPAQALGGAPARRVCGSTTVYTGYGLQKMPVFVLGGSYFVERPGDSHIQTTSGQEPAIGGSFCSSGVVEYYQNTAVLVIKLRNDCLTKSGKYYIKNGRGSFVRLTNKSAVKLVPNFAIRKKGPAGSLSSAQLVES